MIDSNFHHFHCVSPLNMYKTMNSPHFIVRTPLQASPLSYFVKGKYRKLQMYFDSLETTLINNHFSHMGNLIET